MSKFNFTSSSLFKWAAATASQLNTLFDRVREWTVSSLSVDGLLPRSVDTRHFSQPLTWTLSSWCGDTAGIGAGVALTEVFYGPTLGNNKVLAIGFVWPRQDVGVFDLADNGDGVVIALYDGSTGTYVSSTSGCDWTDSWHTRLGLVAAHPFEPLAGFGSLRHKYGGGECIVSTFVGTGPSWVPAGVNVERIGLMGGGSTGAPVRKGQAMLWAFIEDDGQ